MPRLRDAALALSTFACACDEGDTMRREWLQATLVLDNQVFLDTDAELTHGKFARMAATDFAFLRGTIGQWARDVGAPGGAGYRPSAYASVATADVALVGDPHLENLGTFRDADGRLVLDFNDFDAATHGPYHFDVRRLALSVHVAAADLGLDDIRDAGARAVGSGYADEIAALTAGAPAGAWTSEHAEDAIVRDLFKKAAEDGLSREDLSDYTRVVAGHREMYLGEVEPPRMFEMGAFALPIVEDTTTAPSSDEEALARAVLAAYPDSLERPLPPAQFALKGLSRRLGAGVASYPVLRLYALVEGPTAELDDDLLLEIKEVFDAAPFPGLARLPSQAFADDASRIVEQQRAMQTSRLDDPCLGAVQVGDRTFRVRDRTKYQRGIDLERIAEKLASGKFTAADLVSLADTAGRVLARSHARPPKRDGAPALPAIAAALGGDRDGFADEVAEFAADYGEVLAADADRFREIVAEVGPSLGYSPER